MLSVPLTWHDQTVGVLNVQTEQPRDVQRPRRRPARRGRRPARRDHREGPPADRGRGPGRGAQGDRRGAQRADRAGHPRAADAARDRPRLRRPARRRAAAARPRIARPRRAARRAPPGTAATLEQIERLDRLVDSILASVRVVPEGAGRRSRRSISARSSTRSSRSLRPILEQPPRRGRAERPAPRRWPTRRGSARSSSTSSRTPSSTRRPDTAIRIDWSLDEGVVQLGVSDEGPGIPDEWRERIFEPYARRDTHTARGSGIGLYAAKRLGESMGARLWCEPAEPRGARFVVALPAAVGRSDR